MKVPVVNNIKNSAKNICRNITQLKKAADLKPIKNYSQYMKEYGIK